MSTVPMIDDRSARLTKAPVGGLLFWLGVVGFALVLTWLAATRPTDSLLLAMLVAAGLLALVDLRGALLLYFAAAGFSGYLQFFVLHGKSTQGGLFLSELLLAPLALTWLGHLALRRLRVVAAPLSLPLLLVALLPCFSLLRTYATWDPFVPILHRKLVVQLAGAAIPFLSVTAALLAASAFRPGDIRPIWKILAGLSLLSVIDLFRLGSTPGSIFLYAAAPIAFALSFEARGLLRRIALLLYPAAALIHAVSAIKFTLIVLAIAPMLIIAGLRSRRALAGLAIALLLGYLLLSVIVGGSPLGIAVHKAVYVRDFDRLLLFGQALRIWTEHPLFGVGPGGQFAYLGGERLYGTAHSLYANVLLEGGLLGLVALLWLIASASRVGLRLYRRLPDPFLRSFALGQAAGWVGIAAAGALSDTLLPAVQNSGLYMFGASVYSWLLLGTVLALARAYPERGSDSGSVRR